MVYVPGATWPGASEGREPCPQDSSAGRQTGQARRQALAGPEMPTPLTGARQESVAAPSRQARPPLAWPRRAAAPSPESKTAGGGAEEQRPRTTAELISWSICGMRFDRGNSAKLPPKQIIRFVLARPPTWPGLSRPSKFVSTPPPKCSSWTAPAPRMRRRIGMRRTLAIISHPARRAVTRPSSRLPAQRSASSPARCQWWPRQEAQRSGPRVRTCRRTLAAGATSVPPPPSAPAASCSVEGPPRRPLQSWTTGLCAASAPPRCAESPRARWRRLCLSLGGHPFCAPPLLLAVARGRPVAEALVWHPSTLARAHGARLSFRRRACGFLPQPPIPPPIPAPEAPPRRHRPVPHFSFGGSPHPIFVSG